MTSLAEFAEITSMGVLIFVAFGAFLGGFFVLCQGIKVACKTIQTDMLPIQIIFALPVVVIRPEFPAIRVVTCTTMLP